MENAGQENAAIAFPSRMLLLHFLVVHFQFYAVSEKKQDTKLLSITSPLIRLNTVINPFFILFLMYLSLCFIIQREKSLLLTLSYNVELS